MHRIKALNRDEDADSSIFIDTVEKTIEELKEAYMRALQAKRNGQCDSAVEMFEEILNCEEIKQLQSKQELEYLCYKNLAELFIPKSSRFALEYFVQARQLDDTDIYFMSQFGRIAMQLEQYQLANAVFQQCLKLNANHFPSFVGMLEILCKQEDYLEAYGWAVYCHNKFPKYQVAIDVLHDIRELFSGSEFLQSAFTPSLTREIGNRSPEPTLFPAAIEDVKLEAFEDVEPDFSHFKMKTATFPSFGHTIKSIFAVSNWNTAFLTTKIALSDICDMKSCKYMREQSDKDISEATQVCRPQSNTTNQSAIRQIFQEVLPQYFPSEDAGDGEVLQAPSVFRTKIHPDYSDKAITSCDDGFHIESATNFYQFIGALKVGSFDVLYIAFEWLKHMSKCFHIQLPNELQSLYTEIYQYHSSIVCHSWEELSRCQVFDLIEIALFYFELRIVSNVRESAQKLRFFDDQTQEHFQQISFMFKLFVPESDVLLKARFMWLQYHLSIDLSDFKTANSLLAQIQELLLGETKVISLPNQTYSRRIDLDIVASETGLVECALGEASLRKSFASGQYDEVASSILNYRQKHFEHEHFSSFEQIEMLAEALWMTNRLDECWRWCEQGLHESVELWYKSENRPSLFHRLPHHTQFLTSYIHSLLSHNDLDTSLMERTSSRLLRSLTSLLDINFNRSADGVSILFAQGVPLFNIGHVIDTLQWIVTSDQSMTIFGGSSAILNIIVKIAQWLILGNTPSSTDVESFLLAAWNTLNTYDCDTGEVLESCDFNRTEIIRLFSHSLFGYPKTINDQEHVCTCKQMPIDWNAAILMFSSRESVSSWLAESEQKTLLNAFLATIPVNVHETLVDAISRLTPFLNNETDFPHKYIPVKSFPIQLKAIFPGVISSEISCNRYTHEQLIFMNLVINPEQMSSWKVLLETKTRQFEKTYNSVELISFSDVEKQLKAIDVCFERCDILNRARNARNAEYLWLYGLHMYKLYNVFMSRGEVRDGFNLASMPKRMSTIWTVAKKTLQRYLEFGTLPGNAKQRALCYLVVGRMSDKDKFAVDKVLENYLMAERELFNQLDDDMLLIKIEISFRITATIFKYATQIHTENDSVMLRRLLQILKRYKGDLFTDQQLELEIKSIESIDENIGQNDAETHQHLVYEITRISGRQFEWYLALSPDYYKATYYLVRINLHKDGIKCKSLLLQGNQSGSSALFTVRRRCNLFKVKEPLRVGGIQDSASFCKFMEKCVAVLIEYLSKGCDWYLLFVLATQWSKLVKIPSVHLKLRQKMRLFDVILLAFVETATSYLGQKNRVATWATTKAFADCFINICELYVSCEEQIKLSHFAAFSRLLKECYQMYADANGHIKPLQKGATIDEIQEMLEFCAKQFEQRSKSNKRTKHRQNDKTDNNNNPLTTAVIETNVID